MVGGGGDYSVPSHLVKTKSAPNIMDSHCMEIHTLNNACVEQIQYYRLWFTHGESLVMMLENSTHYVKHSMKPFVSIPPSSFFRQELFLHSFNLPSISSIHTMRGRIIFEDLDTTLHVSTFCLLDTMHMTRSPRSPPLPSVLPYCKCVKLEEYTGGQHSEIHIPFVRLNRCSSLVHPNPVDLVFWTNVDPGWVGVIALPNPANTARLVTPSASS